MKYIRTTQNSLNPESSNDEPISLHQLSVASKIDIIENNTLDTTVLSNSDILIESSIPDSLAADSTDNYSTDEVPSISLDTLIGLSSNAKDSPEYKNENQLPNQDQTITQKEFNSIESMEKITPDINLENKYINASPNKTLDSDIQDLTDNFSNSQAEVISIETLSKASENSIVDQSASFSNNLLENHLSPSVNSDIPNKITSNDINSNISNNLISSTQFSNNDQLAPLETSVSESSTFKSIKEEMPTQDASDHTPKMEEKTKLVNSQFESNEKHENNLNKYRLDDSSTSSELKNPISLNYSSKPKTQMPKDQLRYCQAMIRSLKKHGDAGPFLKPVDIVLLNIPDYPSVVKEPMDLSTVESKLKEGYYSSNFEFIADMDLIFYNCYLYNGKDLPISLMAMNLEKAYRNQLKKMPESSFQTPNKAIKSTKVPTQLPTSSATATKARVRRETHPPPSRDIPTSTLSTKRTNSRIIDPQLKFCSNLIREFFKKAYYDQASFFYEPVDWVKQEIPDYPSIVKHPMDMSTIRDKLQNNEYQDAIEFKDDFLLMLNNCYLYNHPKHVVYLAGKALEDIFEKKWAMLPPRPSISRSPSPTPIIHPTPSTKTKTKKVSKQVSPPKPSTFDDSDSDIVMDTPNSARIMSLERHVQQVTRELEDLKRIERLKRSEELKRRAETKLSSGRGQTKKPKKTASTTKTQKDAPVSTPTRGRGAGRKRGSRGGGRGGKTPANSRNSKDSGSYVTELTLSQKREFSAKIETLPAERLQVALNIIRSACPDLVEEEDEIELDIDSLDPYTLKKLYDYVVLCVDLDSEILQSQQSDQFNHINQLEEKLRAFDSENAPIADPITGATLATHRYSSSSDSESAGSHTDDSGDRSD
ncbi:SWR1 complex bromodomain subunit bdf1 [Smittium culicis]|uniref:SWR1 complex bromodomain subunit bdf1 n=1 Tax=Smittium culicis TaxID=133412 RepID=A0A1R1XWH4_9FUNG|nr:SWR1 complex bromodomain subunit bdf1 [Smittium culicis]OMJ25339.1 SWR1 complex bromodomain subunit bdf1 [Smittium culicis]